MGSHDRVSSPTFTISKVYEAPEKDLTMYHFDFYRLHEPGLVAEELSDILGDQRTVIVVEWAGIVQNVLPEHKLTIEIQKMPDDIDARILIFTAPESLGYLMKAVQS